MTVQVRLYAAARAAAHTADITVEGQPLPDLLNLLRETFGSEFARVLSVSSLLIDGLHVPRDSTAVIFDGQQVDVLPPFAGG